MIILSITLTTLVLVASYIIYNLLKKVEKQEDIIQGYQTYLYSIDETIKNSTRKLKEIDRRGTFSSDDEIGWFFEQVKEIQDKLEDYRLKEIS